MIGCERCLRSLWIAPLKQIYLSQLFSNSKLTSDKIILICDVCELSYLNGSQDYCQICYKLYLPENDDLLELQKNISIGNTTDSLSCRNNQKKIAPSLNEEEHLMVFYNLLSVDIYIYIFTINLLLTLDTM